MSQWVSKRVIISNVEFNHSQIAKFLAASKHIKERIWFTKVKIIADSVVNFGDSLDGFKTERIIFDNCGEQDVSDWKNHPERFSNIIEGLGKIKDVRENLTSLHLYRCCLKKDQVEEILEENGFSVDIMDCYYK